ncbi:MAG: hypothetical protein J2P46_09390 [Zavarzinella sp.]|nr:hypothetical protein [Zavarzinella sp.]
MEQNLEAQLRHRIAELEKKNADLMQFNELLQAQRKEYLDIILGPVKEEDLLTEEQMVEMMKTRVSAEDVLRDLDEILQQSGK